MSFLPSEWFAGDPNADEVERLKKENTKLRIAWDAVKAICDHNESCYQACGITTQHDYVRDGRSCSVWSSYKRMCPDCPQGWLIEWPVGSGQFAREP